jgi:hypothetical protein
MSDKKSLALRIVAASAVVIGCLGLNGEARAAYKIGDDTTFLKVGGLLQTWATLDEKKAPDGDSWENEFYLRRMRLMFTGQLTDKVNFFVETDNPNFGKGGDVSIDTFIQDAYLELNLHEMLQVDIGMLLVPFSHQGMQGATSLLPIEYHTQLIKYPGGSHKVWRDYGVMLRGIFLTKWLEYRFGIFNGVHGNGKLATKTSADGLVTWQQMTDPRNASDWPRLTGRLTFNLFDAEGGAGLGGFFYDGIYLEKKDIGIVSTKTILSIGGSVDWQKNLNVTWNAAPTLPDTTPTAPDRSAKRENDYIAVNGDVFADIPLDANKLWSVNGQVNLYYYGYGDRKDNPNAYYNEIADTTSYTGVGISSELGVRYSAFQPVFVLDWFDSTKANGNLGDYMGVFGGFNYWFMAHAVSIKAQFGATKTGAADEKEEWRKAGSLQAQLLF